MPEAGPVPAQVSVNPGFGTALGLTELVLVGVDWLVRLVNGR